MSRVPRALVLLLLAGLCTVLGPVATTPPALAGETVSGAKGNYVALAQPTRVYNASLGTNAAANFTAVGVTGVPRTGTTAVQLKVTMKNTGANFGEVYIETNCAAPCYGDSIEAGSMEGGKGPMSNTVMADIDQTRATNHLKVRQYTYTSTTMSIQVDVVGYYTTASTGGGFVAVRPFTLFDTRANGGAEIPAGGTITKTLTGGTIPTGATAVHMDLVASGIGAAGTVVAVPAGTATTGLPSLNFWTGASSRSGLVTVKLSADGKATFKNTSTASVHLFARAEGYVTSSPGTGADWRPAAGSLWQKSMTATKKIDLQVAGDGYSGIPATGVAGVFVNLEIFAPKGGGYLKIYPKGQPATTASYINFTSDGTYDRSSGAVVVPGEGGYITVEAAANGDFWMSLATQGYYATPTTYATAGGAPELAVAHTSAGPCYAYLEPSSSIVKAGCATGYENNDAIYATLSPAGHTFRGPVSVVARPGGRYVVTALHVPDGEVWTWDLPYSTTTPPTTAVRSFRYTDRPVVTGSLPDGKPVGFTTDADGRVWAIDLNITAPDQPQWKPLDVPAGGISGPLTAVTTTSGIRLAATTATGDVLTGFYTSLASTSLGWQSLGATAARGKVALAADLTGNVGATVYGAGDTASSATITPAGQTVDGWHAVNTSYLLLPVKLAGNPTMVYDPQYDEHWILFRSDENGSGSLYRIREDAPDSGTFTGLASAIPLDSMGIGSDVTAWDYRTDAPPPYRRWSFAYFDTAYGKKGGTYNWQ